MVRVVGERHELLAYLALKVFVLLGKLFVLVCALCQLLSDLLNMIFNKSHSRFKMRVFLVTFIQLIKQRNVLLCQLVDYQLLLSPFISNKLLQVEELAVLFLNT